MHIFLLKKQIRVVYLLEYLILILNILLIDLRALYSFIDEFSLVFGCEVVAGVKRSEGLAPYSVIKI
ncbi:hypothetical protein EMIT019CA3_420004 [Bacillus pseudomycoides]